MQKYYRIAVRICWVRKPALKVATIGGGDRNVQQSSTEPTGSGFGCGALRNTYSLRTECQFPKKDGKDCAENGVTHNQRADERPCSQFLPPHDITENGLGKFA